MDSRSDYLEDPFSDSSLLSLFPRTFNHHHNPGPDSVFTDSPESLCPILDSMVLKNPRRFMEEAKSVRDSLQVDTVEVMRGKNENLVEQVEKVEKVEKVETVNDLPGRGMRPGLGRKKARFSMKPTMSQSVDCLETELDIEHLRDPEQYFLALEKHENAMKELRRQSGRPLTDMDQNVYHPVERRQLRPGLLRNSASVKHRFSMAPIYGDDNAFLSSQEALSQEQCSPTPSNHCFQTEDTDKIPVPSTQEYTGSMVAERDRPDAISEEFQFGEDKDGDDIVGMLEECFKPIVINKICPHDLSNVLQSELLTLEDSFKNSQDKTSDIHGIVSAIGKETTLVRNNVGRNSLHPLTSQTFPRSPQSSMSLLKARLHQSRHGRDRFSTLDILPLEKKAATCKDTHDSAPRDLDDSARSKKMQIFSIANAMHTGPGHAVGGTDTMETNEYESERNDTSKDTQDLAPAKVISPEKSINDDSVMPAVLSDSIENVELDDKIVEHFEMDTGPNVPLHEKESDAADTMDMVKESSKTLDDFSDGAVPIVSDHAIRRDQSPKPAAHDIFINIVHSKGMHDSDAENLVPLKEVMNDISTISGIALDTTLHAESDHGIMVNDTSDAENLAPSKEAVNDISTISGITLDTTPHAELDHGMMVNDSRDAENLAPSKEAMNDISTISGITLDTTPHAELDHGIMVNDTRDRVIEENPSEVFGDAIIDDQHTESDSRGAEEDVQNGSMEKLSFNKRQSTASEDLEKDRHSSGHDKPSSSQVLPLKSSSKKSKDKKRKAMAPPAECRIAKVASKQSREFKDFSKRKSLAACGTQWETGTRRSTRIRTRPLEYWRGERQLYGRIHESLVTVIGAKYFSPAKGAGPETLKVKSYVSDAFREIVEQAALH